MRFTIVLSVWCLFFLALLPARALAFPIHEDETYGYKIAPPHNWNAPTIDSDSAWIIGKFISKKPDYYNDPQGWTWSFKPEMTVVAFVHEVIRGKGISKKESEDEEGDTVTTISFRNPYRNYLDYLKRTYHGGGYYVSEEETTTVKGVETTCYTVKVEKLTRTGPRLLIAWVYHMDDLDIAVQFEILEESYIKFRKDISRSLKSFRVIKRAGSLPTGEVERITSRLDWDKLDPTERACRRLEAEQKAHEKALAGLKKGWKHTKVGNILVLDNFDTKKAKKIAKQCQTIMKWLDKNFDYIGPEEYVRAPIVKVFKADDLDSLSFRFGGFDDIVIEYEHNPDWLVDFRFEMINLRILELWFNDRDRDLYYAMPHWVRHGLQDLIQNSKVKGSKVEFPRDIYDRVHLKQAHSKGTLSTPRELVMMGLEQFYSVRYKSDEASALVRYLLVGPGSKSKKTRDLLRRYIENLAEVTAEIKEEEKESGPEAKPTTEEEEDEYFKNSQNSWKEEEKRILEETFNRTFADWSDRDWKTLNASFKRMIDD